MIELSLRDDPDWKELERLAGEARG